MQLKKSLGQHFLKDENICKNIVQAVQQQPFTQLLEVGPGGGALTKYLVQIPNISFKAVELDDEKVAFLSNKFPTLRNNIIHQDFLDIDVPFTENFTVVGNFPYNISTQIVFKLLDWKTQVECMVGMFQKEVAERIAAKPGSKTYGVISVLVQAYFSVEYLFEVLPQSFEPPPKVMSGVIRMKPKAVNSRQLTVDSENVNGESSVVSGSQIVEDDSFTLPSARSSAITNQVPIMKSEKLFRLLVKTAFQQRRKMLRNGVRGMFDEAFLKNELFNKRAEQLSVEDFAALTFKMK